MTPLQKVKQLVLIRARQWQENDEAPPGEITEGNVDSLYAALNDNGQDARQEVREGEVETGLDGPCSRHYEAKEVAAQMPDGSWVGWTYWYGGGKHGNPEEIDWMPDAYDLTCKEEEKVVTVRTFTKAE